MKIDFGQMLMMGVDGISLTEAEKEFVQKNGIGGVILFDRNYEELEHLIDLVNEIHSLSSFAKPFIAVDQEGGGVMRLKRPFTQFPGNDYLGRCYEATKSLDLVREYASTLADELMACGVRVCLAPVLDVLTNPKNKVIGRRAFSKDAAIVAELGSAVISGLMKAGVISCAKHFPGHGDTDLDSHEALPRVRHGIDFIRERELVPFKKAIEANVPMIMTAHVLYESIDPDFPATISKKIIWDLLREEMGYKNLVITDDLEMKGISGSWDVADAAVKAINAGVDIILVCKSKEKLFSIYERLAKEIELNSEFRQKVERSLERIKRFKNLYSNSDNKIDLMVAMKAFNTNRSVELIDKIRSYS
jgi:beta-N-acetylhexosaminidase